MDRNGAGGSERIGVVLSAGFFGFFAHAGFLVALEELGIEYQAIAGSSAGALVAAFAASGMPPREIAGLLTGLRRQDFWDPSFLRILQGLVTLGRGWTGLLTGHRLESLIESHLRVKTFEECSKALYVSAVNLTTGKNVTFSDGTIADKVCASCSYPFLFAARRIGENRYWDGGVTVKVPLEVMREKAQVNRIIVHYLPSAPLEESNRFLRRPLTPLHLMLRGLDITRREIESLRREKHEGGGSGVQYVTTQVPRCGPDRLHLGPQIVEAARASAHRALLAWKAGVDNHK